MDLASLQSLLLEVRKRVLYVEHFPSAIEDRKRLVKALQALHSALQDTPARMRAALVAQNLNELRVLRKLLAKIPGPPLAQLRHEVFDQLLPIHGMPELVTILFNELVQGITAFDNDTPTQENPIYHRMESCGPHAGQARFLKAHKVCTPGRDAHKTRKHKRSVSERCYIERLIYDQLYQNHRRMLAADDPLHTFEYIGTDIHPASQDAGHQEAMIRAENDFMSCCPGCAITVQVGYTALAASSVTMRRFKNGRLLSEEHYTKEVQGLGAYSGRGWTYGGIVACYKTVADKNYFKAQTTEREERWRPIDARRAQSLRSEASRDHTGIFDSATMHTV